MTNNLRQISKDLRAFAKRTKDFKYTDSALIIFLITGMVSITTNLFPATTTTSKSIETQKQEISSSIKGLHQKFKETRRENEKLLKDTNLELVKLMEQGDHVVKAPFSSWQFGINEFYNDWHGTYKGRGNKQDDIKYDRSKNKIGGTYNGGKYGATELAKITEPIASIPLDASVTPKNINKTRLNINLPNIATPATPRLNVRVADPLEVKTIEPKLPDINPSTPSPNLNPFSSFTFLNGFWDRSLNRGYDNNGHVTNYTLSPEKNDAGVTFWAGYNPDTHMYTQGYGNTNLPGHVAESDRRPGVLIYLANGSPTYTHVTAYVAGNIRGTGNVGTTAGPDYTKDRGGVVQHLDNTPHNGQIAFHLFGKNTVEDSDVHMYGRANAFSLETWQMHTWTFNNDHVDITAPNDSSRDADQNIVFNIYPSYYQTTTGNYSSHNRGKFAGDGVSADLTTRKNIVYSVIGNAGSFGLNKHGTYFLEGAENTLYSDLGYQANYGAFGLHPSGSGDAYNGTDYTLGGFKPYLNFKGSDIISTGDDNIIMFFAPTTVTDATPYLAATYAGSDDQKKSWAKSVIGIYQGEINAGARIGTVLAKAPLATKQTKHGNLYSGSDSDKWVEKNVGVFAASGQRDGISSVNDLGAVKDSLGITYDPSHDFHKNETNGMKFENDVIHSLQINKADFEFGKYSKNGVMFASQNGTVVDVLKDSNKQDAEDYPGHKIATVNQTKLTDYGTGTAPTSSENDTSNGAATGTIIALAQGTWGNGGVNGTMSSITKGKLTGLASEINIGKDVEMSARYHKFSDTDIVYPIAYAATDGGKVELEDGKSTTALGYGSIIGYTKGVGQVIPGSNTGLSDSTVSTINVNGDVTAVDGKADSNDSKTKELMWTNVGGYAVDGGTVNLGKSTGSTIKINGLAAYATGKGTTTGGNTKASTVNVYSNSGSAINTGAAGALVAKNGGMVNFYGGTITHKDNGTISGKNDHDNTTPFYSFHDGTNANGQIKFQGPTTLKMYDGVLITGNKADYDSSTSSTAKYQGLSNVTVNIYDHNVTLGSFDGLGLEWDDKTDSKQTYQNGLPGISKFAGGKVNLISGATYKSILVNGKLDVEAPTVDLSDSGDLYNGIQMGNEMVTIKNSTTVTGNVGATNIVGQGKAQGLSMGNVTSAVAGSHTADNTSSGFINEGTVNVTGGTAANGIAGINVSYGSIQNKNAVTVDNGAGLYGTNGSKLVNESTGTVTVTGSGVGIAGLGTGTKAQAYGTDKTATVPTVEIENHGTINVAGDNAIGIFANNNTGAARNGVTVKNDHQLTVGKSGVGIAVVSEAPGTVVHGTEDGGTLTATASGAGSDIITGVDGRGIFAKNSDVNLTGGDYVIETKDDGVGIFASGTTNINGTLEYKYSGNTSKSGMGIVYDQKDTKGNTVDITNTANVKLNNAAGTTGGMIGIYTLATNKTLTNTGTITGNSPAKEFGIVTNGADVVNKGTITLGNATSQSDANVGIYSKSSNKITNDGTITIGNNAIGIYGYGVENNGTINTGKNGTAIYTDGNGEPVHLSSTSVLNIGDDQAVGAYIVGKNQTVTADSGSQFNIGKNSFGFVNAGQGNTINSNTASVSLGKDTVYIYQNDNTGKVFNNTKLTSTGDRNYGLYGNGTMENNAVIDFASGKGNVGIYSTGGTATNNSIIKVGETNLPSKEFGIGMATGYYDKTSATPFSNQGTIINNGTIEVSKPNTMGMYAVGPNSKAINYGNINLSGSNTVGMYIDQGAKGENWGKIQTTANGLSAVKGIYLAHGSYIKNYGEINIAASDTKSAGIWSDGESADNAEEHASGVNPTTGSSQTGTSTPAMKVVTATDHKTEGGVTIKVPPAANPVTVTDVNGNVIPITGVDTNVPTPTPTTVNITDPTGVTVLDLSTQKMGNVSLGSMPSSAEAYEIGMYVDTSGVNYTNPIKGLNNLSGLTDINLYFGPEAARYTTSKVIEVGDNILSPYNRDLSTLITAGTTLNVTSPSITWMAQPTKDPAGLLDKVYLVKIPYTALAKKGDRNTYNFLDGLEQRYGVEGIGTRENELFQKLNGLTEGEGHILAQAVDEMKGHQYANTQQRINATGNTLDKEFIYLRDEWRNPSKQNNKIKLFSQRDEYNTDTAGIKDYRSNAYGVAYVHEDETVKMGHSSGWYAGAVTNRFKFKDLGKSKEDQTMIKAGVFKTISPKGDHNGALKWTVSGDAFYGINNMKRKYWIVDDVFEAKSNYNSYGVALKNELGYDIRMSERTHLRPFGALKMEYGRFTGIKEDSGQMRLEVKGNDYFSVKPEVGMEFKYVQPLAVRTNLTVGLSAAYENEIGKLQKGNKARVRYTAADWYNLEKEKEDRRGNGKFDLNIGVDNTRFGVTVNGGYDTKGNNVRGGIGFRAIY